MPKPSPASSIRTDGHWSTDALSVCLPLNSGSGGPVDFAGGRTCSLLSGASWTTLNGEPAVQTTAGSNGVQIGTVDNLPKGATTVVWGYGKLDTTNRASGGFGFSNNTGRLGCHFPWSDGNAYLDLESSSNRLTKAGLTFAPGSRWAWVLQAPGSATPGELFKSGTSVGTGGTAQTRTDAGGPFYLGRHSTGLADFAVWEFMLVYGRALSSSEVASLHADPYQMFAASRPAGRSRDGRRALLPC